MNDKIDELYDALKADGAVKKSRENFRSYVDDADNRQKLYEALKADGAVKSPTFEEFSRKLGYSSTPAARPTASWPKTSAVPVAPWRKTSAMPEDVRQRFDAQQQAEEHERRQRTAMGNTEIGWSAQAMQRKKEEQERQRQQQMHDNPTHSLTEEQRRGAYPGDTGILANPYDLTNTPQMEVNRRVTREEIEKAVPRIYEPAARSQYIDKAVEEYSPELGTAADWKRRQEETKKAQREHVAEQVDNMLGNVESMRIARQRELEKEYLKNHSDGSIWARIGQSLNAVESPNKGMGAPQYLSDEQLGMMTAAERKLKSLQKTIDEAQKHAEDPNWFAEFGRGMGAGLSDISTWDFGITDLADANKIQKALEKYDRIAVTEAMGGKTDEKMTPAEQALLDAVATEIVVNEYYGSDVSNWYKGGQSTAVSIPFMASMIVSPAMAAGRSASAAMARYITKRFAQQAAKKGVQKVALRAAEGALKATSRVTIDAGAAAMHTAMFDQGRIAADTKDRMIGQIMPTYDSDGNVRYGGHMGGDNEDVARRKAMADAFIQNASEMLGDYIPGAKVIFGNTKLLKRMMKNPYVKRVAIMEKRAQFHGFLPEMLEEISGGVANATWVGDQTLDDDPETGVFSKDNINTTLISIGAITITMGIAKLGAYGASYRQMKATDRQAAQLFGDEWADLRTRLQSENMADVEAAVNDIADNSNYSEEQKQAAAKYAMLYAGVNAYDHMDDSNKDIDAKNANDTYKSAYEDATSEEVRRDVTIMMEQSREKVRQTLGDEILQKMEEDDPLSVKQTLEETQQLTDEQATALADYVAAHNAVTGINDRINDEADSFVAQQREAFNLQRNDDDGSLHPATMNVDGQQRQVFIKSGLVTANPNGTIDIEHSGETIVVYDPVEGKSRMVSPSDLAELGEVVPQDQFEADLQNRRSDLVQQQQDAATGRFNPKPGEEVAMPNGNRAFVMAVSGDNVTVQLPDGTQQDMSIADIQAIADGVALNDYMQRHPEAAPEPPTDSSPQMSEGHPDTYQPGMTLTIQRDGEEPQQVTVTGARARWTPTDGYVEDPNGRYVQIQTPDGSLTYIPADDPNGIITGYMPAPQEEPRREYHPDWIDQNNPPDDGGTPPPPPAAVGNLKNEEEEPSEPFQSNNPMPMRQVKRKVDGKMTTVEEEDWMATTPSRAYQYLYEEAAALGLPVETADNILQANLKAAQREMERAKKTVGSVVSVLQKQNDAQAAVDYWQQVQSMRQAAVDAEKAEAAVQRRAELEELQRKDDERHEQAVAEEQQRQADELAKREEQARLGANNVAPAIREKWNNAKKVKGFRDRITLPNGTVITGTHMIVEAKTLTPSHDGNNEFKPTDGFPVDENGQNINTRDYYGNKQAQESTLKMAENFDERGQGIVVNGDSGIALSGNGRTIAAQIAARKGTDGKYQDYLQNFGQNHGYTPEQVNEFEHPIDVFVPDEIFPYDSKTFHMFNESGMKSQSRTEEAVTMGKTVDDDTFRTIVNSVNGFDTMSQFYSDPKAPREAIVALRDAGVIGEMDMAKMFDGDKVSAAGREVVESALIGKAFEGNPDALRQLAAYPSMRENVVTALAAMGNNIKLGPLYSLESEFAEAVNLAYQAHKNGYKDGEPVSVFARQQNLFPFDSGDTVADYTNVIVLQMADRLNSKTTTDLKNYYLIYNDRALQSAKNQTDLFAGGVKSKLDLFKEAIDILQYGTELERKAALAEADKRRIEAAKSDTGGDSVQKDGAVDNGGEGTVGTEGATAEQPAGGEPTDTAPDNNTAAVAERITAAEAQTDTNPTEGQKKAGNYKMGHVTVDGYDISIENPKGSIRRGTDPNGRAWEQEMHNTYGYIRGTTGVDGDHIDIFLSDDPSQGSVFVIDQVNADGSFDEHKVMYGFPDAESARQAYLSNYEDGWQGLGTITQVSKDEFKKWVESSHRKTKPFSEYKSVKPEGDVMVERQPGSAGGVQVENGVKGNYDLSGGNAAGRVREQKSDNENQNNNEKRPSEAQKALRDGLVKLMRSAGLDVVTDKREGQQTLDKFRELVRLMSGSGKMKTTSDTRKLNSPEGEKAYVTVISDAESGAKVRKNLDTLAKKYEEKSSRLRNLLNDIAEALGAKQRGSGSKYVTIEAQNGNIVTIRLANHNASVRNFDNNGEPEGVSIVVAGTPNNGIENNGEAHVVEFFYRAQDLRSAEGKPLVKIIRSVEQMLYSGEYRDTTGLAQVQEVNAETLREMRAYHGSGADFDAFDHSHMGEGEGAQAYGWGTYVTEVEGIGKAYAKSYGTKYQYDDEFHSFRKRYGDVLKNIFSVYATDTIDDLRASIKSYERDRDERNDWNIPGYEEEWHYFNECVKEGKAILKEWEKFEHFIPDRILYTVDIPDDNGSNYLEWDQPIGEENIGSLIVELEKHLLTNDDYYKEQYKGHENDLNANLESDFKSTDEGRFVYETLAGRLGSDKAASEFLHSMGYVGIKYPAEYMSGGRSDGAKNYVVFDEGDLKITDKARLFRTEEGEVWGYTMDGKIYIDPSVATAETPIHEYTHLWTEALRKANPEAWERLNEEMRQQEGLMDYVRSKYPELTNEDELMDEVFAHYSGRRGAERLESDMREAMAQEPDLTLKAQVALVFHRLREVLQKFWSMARDLFAGKVEGLEGMTAEDFADMALGDLLRGFDPIGATSERTATRQSAKEARDKEYLDSVERGDIAKVLQKIETAKNNSQDTENETSEQAKRDTVQRLADAFHTNINIVTDIDSIQDSNPEQLARKRRSPGWYSLRSREVTVVLPNNSDATDAASTVFHEVVGHKGMRKLVGDDNYDTFLDEVYSHLTDELKEQVDHNTYTAFMDDILGRTSAEQAEGQSRRSYEQHRRIQTDEMIARMAETMPEDMTDKERSLWQRICDLVRRAIDRFLNDVGVKLPRWVRLGENEIRYMLWRSRQHLEQEGYVGMAKDIAKRHDLGLDDQVSFRDAAGDSTLDDLAKDNSMGLKEKYTAWVSRLAAQNRDDDTMRRNALRAISDNLDDIRRAVSIQKQFDQSTVKRVADLARVLLSGGYLDNLTSGEVKRLLSAVKNSTGRSDITASTQKVMDIMVDNQLKRAEKLLHGLETVKAKKVNAKGVEVQGELDLAGQQMITAFKKGRALSSKEVLEQHIADAQDRMGSSNQTIADEAANEYAGLKLALQYAEDIKGSEDEESDLRDELERARLEARRPDGIFADKEAYDQYRASIEDNIRQNRIERLQAYLNLAASLTDSLGESVKNALAFREAEKERIADIQHNANSDMEGRPSNEHYTPDWKAKAVNNSFAQFFLQPLATFDQMLRLFGSKSANGEGYLYNRFMRGWVDARQQEIRGVRQKYATLDAKVKQIFGKDASNMADLIRRIGNMPKMTVQFWNGGAMRDHTLTQGNLMYIYMVDKMDDGRLKLRAMGVKEAEISKITRALDPRLIELADWLQDEFLVETRNEYNETHKRLFGASMAAIDKYFPLKILANARADKPEDLDNPNFNEGVSTTTGSIIKRRRNALALDVLNADALNVVVDHVAQMEHWNAFAEFNRDLNTLRTYKRFRNQVQNMTTVYGSGKELWKKFNDVSQIAAGSYRPPRAKLDEAAVNIAKGVTAAKVSLRIFTALKQFLSMPAYIPDARPDLWAKNLATPWNSWSWAMDNLPIFEERWKGRMAGDPRLLKSELDWKGWRNRIVQMAAKYGMSPNAFVDALTVSIGAKTIYETRRARYIKEGFSEEQADRRAKQDAEIAYNETQQSSEGAFLSPMQVDRSWLDVMFTVFRNSSMAYQRQLHDALRNLIRDFKKGNREQSIEFMAKQLMRDGLPEDKAQAAAKSRYNRQIGKDILRVATFGYILQLAWNLGAKLPYLLFGGDDDKKKEMMDDVWAQSMFGWAEGLTGGDVFSQAGMMLIQGKGNPEYLKKEMPAVSDIGDILKELGKKKYHEAITDIINLVVQAGIGVNPQTLTDIPLAIMDRCGNDPKLAKESLIMWMRILQVPQSQIKELYLDEIDMTGEEASKLTPEQLAERYAKYQVKRGRFFQPWEWDNEDDINREKKNATKKIKERVDALGGKDVNNAYEDLETRYKDFEARKKEVTSTTEYKDAHIIEKDDLLTDFYDSDPQGTANAITFKALDGILDKIVKHYLDDSRTANEALVAHETILEYKKAMLEVLNAGNKDEREKAREKLEGIVEQFYRKFPGNREGMQDEGYKISDTKLPDTWSDADQYYDQADEQPPAPRQ